MQKLVLYSFSKHIASLQTRVSETSGAVPILMPTEGV